MSVSIVDIFKTYKNQTDNTFDSVATEYANLDIEWVVKNGNQTISANTSWGSATPDTRNLLVLVKGNLTVDAGYTLTAAARKRGMFIYVNGNCTVNGTISMTARGAKATGAKLLLFDNNTILDNYSLDKLTGGTASADSVYSATYDAAKGCDNNDTTRWHTADGVALPHWWKYDFGAGVSHAICKVSIKAADTIASSLIWIKDFKVQGSNNDSDWTDLYTGQHGFNNNYEDFAFINRTKYRYLRIYITSNWNGVGQNAGFFEIQAYSGTEYQVPAAGGAGGAALGPLGGSGGGYVGNTGTSGVATGACGGGGSGGAGVDGYNCYSGAGAAGTSYSGGAGGGGVADETGTVNASPGNANGGAGGAAASNHGNCKAGGGAGNNGGAGVYGDNGGNGTGGLLVLYVTGTLTFGAAGALTSLGTAGGAAASAVWRAGGGGGSGGGRIDYFYNAVSGTPTVTVTGGAGGTASGGVNAGNGGAGGAGSSRATQVSLPNLLAGGKFFMFL